MFNFSVSTFNQTFETERRAELDKKRDELKVSPSVVINYNYVSGILTCPKYARTFSNRLEYATHGTAHRRAKNLHPYD